MAEGRRRPCAAPLVLLAASVIVLHTSVVQAGYNGWTGDGPRGGTIVSLAFAADGATVLAIAQIPYTQGQDTLQRGALYRSTDQGRSWSLVGGPVAAIDVKAIATHPVDPAIAWLADSTGAVWQSNDKGRTWAAISALPLAPLRIAVDPDTPSLLYASFWNSGVPIYRSVDSGYHWGALAGGPTWSWAATAPGGKVYAGPNLMVSDGPRASWSPLPSPQAGYGYWYGVVANPHMPDTIYVFGEPGVFRSGDGGATWHGALSVSYVWDLAIDPTDPQRLYAVAGVGQQAKVFHTNDGGGSWAQSDAGAVNLRAQYSYDVYREGRGIAVDPAGSHTVLACGWGGTGVTRWEGGLEPGTRANAGLPLEPVSIAPDPNDPQRVLAGTSGLGLLESVDQCESWRPVSGLDTYSALVVAFAPSDPSVAFVAGQGGLSRSDDGAQTWTSMAYGQVCRLAIDPFDPDTIIMGICSRFVIDICDSYSLRSHDGGSTWAEFPVGCSSDAPGVVFDPRHRGRLYYPAAVSVSNDGGDTWTTISDQHLRVLAFDPTLPNRLYGFDDNGQLLASDDGGVSWSALLSLPGAATAVITDLTSTGTVFAATDQGVFMSLDHGSTWSALGSASAPRSATALAVRPGNGFTLYATPPEGGVKVFTTTATPRRHLPRATSESKSESTWQVLGMTSADQRPPSR
jgi:photosystem II stability/assembly factor-like uncharacterized protein